MQFREFGGKPQKMNKSYLHGYRYDRNAQKRSPHRGLLAFFLVTILAQTLLAFVRCNLVTFTFTAAGHIYLCLSVSSNLKPDANNKDKSGPRQHQRCVRFVI